MRPHSFTFGEIMDDYFLMLMWMVPLFFAVASVRSILDDIKKRDKR